MQQPPHPSPTLKGCDNVGLLNSRAALLRDLAGLIVQQHVAEATADGNSEHIGNRVVDAVERAVADPLAAEPVVFDKVHCRRQVQKRVIDVVELSIGRNNQQLNTWTVSAAALRVRPSDAVEQRELR